MLSSVSRYRIANAFGFTLKSRLISFEGRIEPGCIYQISVYRVCQDELTASESQAKIQQLGQSIAPKQPLAIQQNAVLIHAFTDRPALPSALNSS